MGCAQSKVQLPQLVRLSTVNGVLKVTIVNAKIEHETSTLFDMDPYIKLKVSNQIVSTQVVKKGGKQPFFNESFNFFINSCYQAEGRHLELELWDSNKTSDSLIGFGMADIDPILQSKDDKKQKNLRVFLNYDMKAAGIVNLEVEFMSHPFDILNFRFETVTIRRKTSSFGNMNCFVRVTIGEEVLKTKKKKDTAQMPPVWIDQVLVFNVPKIIKNCLVEVVDENQVVGEIVLAVEDLLKETKQNAFDEDIIHNNAIAGTLRFQTITGQNVQFSQIKRDYKRKSEIKKVSPQFEEKEGEKGKQDTTKKENKQDVTNKEGKQDTIKKENKQNGVKKEGKDEDKQKQKQKQAPKQQTDQSKQQPKK